MLTRTETTVEDIIAGWRAGEPVDNPAGPLFPSGKHTEQELLTMTHGSGYCGTNCTYSAKYDCC